MLFGVSLGLIIGFGAFLLRKKFWSSFDLLGKIGLLVLLPMGGLVIIFLLFGASKGGDGGMAAMVGVVLGAMGVGLAAIVSAILASIQSRVIGVGLWKVARTGIIDVFLLGSVLLGHQTLYLDAQQRALTNDWWQKESEYRQRTKMPSVKIPDKYKGYNTQVLNMMERQRKEIEARGFKIERQVPLEVEQAIRNSEAVVQEPRPVADMGAYARINEEGQRFRVSLIIAWILGALVLPICFPKGLAKPA